MQENSLSWRRGRYDFRVPQEHWVPTQRDQPRVLPGGKAGGPQPFRRPGPSEGALMAAARGDGRWRENGSKGPEKGGGVNGEPQRAGGGAAGGAAKAGSEHALTALPSKKQLILQLCDVEDPHLQACCRAPRALGSGADGPVRSATEPHEPGQLVQEERPAAKVRIDAPVAPLRARGIHADARARAAAARGPCPCPQPAAHQWREAAPTPTPPRSSRASPSRSGSSGSGSRRRCRTPPSCA